MKTLLIILTALLMTTAVHAQNFYEAWPCKVTADTPIIDFGMMKSGTTVTKSFSFMNDGTEPLLISVAKKHSQNFSITIPKGPINPGSKATITIKFEATTQGKFRKKIEFPTNCTKKPAIVEVFGTIQ